MQAIVPYDIDLQESNNYLPISLGIGKTWLLPELFQELNNLRAPFNVTKQMEKISIDQEQHIQTICQIFREELIICMERLRYLRLENAEHTGEIQKPKRWGETSKHHQNLLYKTLKLHLQPPTVTNKTKEVLKIESTLQRKIAYDSEPILSADTFLYPSQEILSAKSLQVVLPSLGDQEDLLDKVFDEITLPFDKKEYFVNLLRLLNQLNTE